MPDMYDFQDIWTAKYLQLQRVEEKSSKMAQSWYQSLKKHDHGLPHNFFALDKIGLYYKKH